MEESFQLQNASHRMNGADRASQRTLIAVAWLKVLVIGALLGTLFGALTWNDAFPFAWLKSWWLAAPNPWGRALLALLPVAFLWASAPRRRGDDEPAASCFDTWWERVLSSSFRGTLGLARPWHAPGLLHLYIFSLTTGLSVASLASTSLLGSFWRRNRRVALSEWRGQNGMEWLRVSPPKRDVRGVPY